MRRSQSGFQLIEVAIALGLFILTLVIFGVAVSTAPLTKTARNENLAYHIALKKIEELRHTPYGSLPPDGTTGFVDPGFVDLESPNGLLTIAPYGVNELKQVTVQVTWEEASGSRAVTLETLMGSRGLNQ